MLSLLNLILALLVTLGVWVGCIVAIVLFCLFMVACIYIAIIMPLDFLIRKYARKPS